MSGDTDKAKISDNQDEDKKSGAGDGHTTEDESSQDSKGELVSDAHGAPGNATVDQPDSEELHTGDSKTTANGKDEDAAGDDSKDGKDSKDDSELKKEENGETHEENDKGDVKENDKGGKAAAKKKPKKEDTEEEDEEDEELEEEEEEEGEEGEEEEEKEKEKKPKEKAKKAPKKAKDGDDEGEDDEEGEEEGEEEEEEEEEEVPKPKPKKEPMEPPVPIPAGKGIPLGHISNVEVSLSRFKTQDQKLLHQYLYGQLCLDRNVKRNIKKFKGYEWAVGSSDYKAKLEETTKMEPKQLRTMCEMLDLDKKGSSSDLSSRLVGFLQQPVANSPHARGQARAAPAPHAQHAPGGRPRRSAAVKVHNRGYSDEEYESDPETKVKGPKPAKGEGSEDSDGSFNPSGSEADSDFDPEGGEGAAGPTRKRKSSGGGRRRSAGRPSKKGKKGKGKRTSVKPSRGRGRKAKSDSEEESDKSESESEAGAESGSEGEESDEPKSKRGRPSAVVAKGRKPAAGKTPVKATPVKRKPPSPPAKKKGGKPGRPAKKGKKASSEESGEGSEDGDEGEADGSDEEESGEESDTPADKKAKRPPTDDEIKKYVKQILEGANLEQITMKTVCKQVYSHYPDFDLAHKKDFIKATVKSLISS